MSEDIEEWRPVVGWALEHDVRYGVFGGVSERDRRKMAHGGRGLKPNGHRNLCRCMDCKVAR